MKISATTSYAIYAALHIARARSGNAVPTSQLIAEGTMPERFLPQVLRQLVTGGILRSSRGIYGGYVLARKAEDISPLEIIEAIDGPVNALVDDSLAKEKKVRSAIEEATAKFRRVLQATKLSDLLA